MTFKTTITIPTLEEEQEIDVTIDFRMFGKHVPAIWNVSPEEWPEVEIESVVDGSGKDYTEELTKDQWDTLHEEAYAYAESYHDY